MSLKFTNYKQNKVCLKQGAANFGTRCTCNLELYINTTIISLLQSISASHIGCYIGCMPVNILAYADDIVTLSPSWRGLQALIDNLLLCAQSIDMACNACKNCLYGH